MKRLILFMVTAIGMNLATVQASIVNLRLETNRAFIVYVDGVKIGPASNVQRIEGLTAGDHHFKVLEVVPSYYWKPAKKLVFNSTVPVKPGVETHAVINGFNSFFIEQQFAIAPQPQHGGGYGHGGGHTHPGNGNVCTVNQDQYIQPMCPKRFAVLKNTIAGQCFESTKVSIAKNALRNNFVTSKQVRQLLNLMHFESSKLEIAMFAYQRTVDQHLFYVVYDQFHFNSSIQELDNYIAMY